MVNLLKIAYHRYGKEMKTLTNLLTEEDKEIAFEYIILSLVVQALERDLSAIEKSKLKLKTFHEQFLNHVINDIRNNLIEHKKLMRNKGIKVLEKQIISEEFWSYKYLVRGFNSEFRCLTYALKMHVEKRLEKYIKNFS
jgi:SRSO17 transposase